MTVNHAQAAVTVGWVAAHGVHTAGGTERVHNCALHGPKSNHTTAGCEETKKLAAAKKSKGSGGTQGKGGTDDVVCRECGEVGHKKINCPRIVCNDCNKKGHIARNCPEKKNKASVSAATDQDALMKAMTELIDTKLSSFKVGGKAHTDHGNDSDDDSAHSVNALVPDVSDSEDCQGTWGVGGT